ncbi:hypothetical protein LAZ67_15002542 [Cordylochernes scorpioides]|uniref:Transposase n=1 Tax=Cordylochernes scorpioides TaxID=51811 RepID=A0ABY6L9M7_9ARAC|nr:hypothetical protein LAZ67_15002542 [Cordylochernes scorpioides]
MRRVAAKFVPKLLNCDQKQHRMNIANEMLDSVRDDPNLLQRVITGDEAWVYGYDVETKAQSSQWKLPHEPRPKKARQVRSNVKVLLTVFFDCRGVVHHEFLPQGRTVNKEYYLQVMRKLHEAIRQKRPDLWKNKNWLLHHNKAPAHTLLLVRDFLAKNNTLMMPQPPYSSDLAPCDFFLFPKLKRPMKGRRYATLDEIKTASKEELKRFLKMIFLKCFEDWKNRWHKCIISHGDYFEGNKIVHGHQKWCREFNEGWINVHDEQRSGQPSLPESTVNRRITLEEIEDGLNEDCSHFSMHKIVSETLGYRKVSARWVDKWLKEAAGEWYNTGITKLVDRMKKVIEHQGDYVEKYQSVQPFQ